MPLSVRAAPHATSATRESRRPACEHLRERLNFYDMYGELALYAHTPSLTYAKRRRTTSLACFPAITI
jgi:hypothetical protein